jgi:predicted aspartyl protease
LTIREIAVGTPVSESELQVPTARRHLVEFPLGVDTVRLPARIDFWGRIIVRVDIGGRGLDFYLDSGCDDITIDRDVARELGLKSYGKWSETVAGSFSASKTVVPTMQIGKLLLTNAVVSALPFNFQNDWSTKVVGLLGYDFIAGAVLKIDYDRGTVDAIRSDFKLPAASFVASANLDDYVPMIPVQVNGVAGDHFVLDTGADQIMVFSSFTRRNPGVVPEDGTLAFEGGDFVTTEGVGGRLHVRVQRLKKLGVNNVEFNDFVALVMWGDQPAFEGEKADGLIGASVLSAFDNSDYPHSRVVFVPNNSGQHNKAARGLGSAADRP